MDRIESSTAFVRALHGSPNGSLHALSFPVAAITDIGRPCPASSSTSLLSIALTRLFDSTVFEPHRSKPHHRYGQHTVLEAFARATSLVSPSSRVIPTAPAPLLYPLLAIVARSVHTCASRPLPCLPFPGAHLMPSQSRRFQGRSRWSISRARPLSSMLYACHHFY
ncbi:hypothetical protein OH77DRAFT_1044731 [Trametes cingulata]|nr:hypothetical protein OH77DRAFT_1044731 [Trametes cingulata]